MSDTIISVENLGKRYALRHQRDRRYVALRDVLTDKAKWLFKRNPRNHNVDPTREDFWALKDVSLEVKRGEVVGIIGHNGAGKSTLLKILSRITEPTEGRVTIKGRVASLLEVGTGFHPELTGRENIFLNGAILGMSRTEIKKKFEEIVAFAEIEKFLDTPVKRYSSGMYVRLAFAVAAHLEPEILVVDEVLAVGDAEFQEKCLGRMEKVAGEGRTILLVSHNMSTIQQLCTRCILVQKGQIHKSGNPAKIVEAYLSDSRPESNLDIRDWRNRSGSGEARIVRLTLADENSSPSTTFSLGEMMQFWLEAEFYERVIDPCFGVVIHGSSGEPLLDLKSMHDGLRVGSVQGNLVIEGSLSNINLYPGNYFLSPWITDASVQRCMDFPRMCCRFQVLPTPGEFGDLRLDPLWGKFVVNSQWKVRRVAPQ